MGILTFFIREFASAQDFTTSKSKHSIEKDSLPPKPKKPPNVFLLYYTSVKNKLREEHPHCTQRELLKKASEKWAQADSTIKQNLQKQYLEQTSMYKQKLMDYENSLTDEQKMKIIQELLKKGHTLKKGEIKQVFISCCNIMSIIYTCILNSKLYIFFYFSGRNLQNLENQNDHYLPSCYSCKIKRLPKSHKNHTK